MGSCGPTIVPLVGAGVGTPPVFGLQAPVNSAEHEVPAGHVVQKPQGTIDGTLLSTLVGAGDCGTVMPFGERVTIRVELGLRVGMTAAVGNVN